MTRSRPVQTFEYQPDSGVAPGETLVEWLAVHNMSQAEFARRTGLSTKHINQVANGAAGLSAEVALAFESVTEIPARYWSQLEANHRAYEARIAENEILAKHVDLLKRFPVPELIGRQRMRKADDAVGQLRELLRFFGVATVDALTSGWTADAKLRASRAFPPNEAALSAWLRMAELDAQEITVEPFDAKRCEEALQDFKSYTCMQGTSWIRPLKDRCASVGIALTIVKELPRCRVNGATRWLNPSKAMVALSLRHRRHDILWFTFFHELGHLLRHSRRQTFVDAEGTQVAQDLERDADRFAGQTLISPEYQGQLEEVRSPDDAKVLADQLGVDVSIIVGRLQHEKLIPFSKWNDLIPRYRFHDDN